MNENRVIQFPINCTEYKINGVDIREFIYREFRRCYCPEYLAWGDDGVIVLHIKSELHRKGHIVRRGQWIEYNRDLRDISVTDNDPRIAVSPLK